MALGRAIGIVLCAMQWILRGARAEASLCRIYQRDTHAERAKIHTCHDCHVSRSLFASAASLRLVGVHIPAEISRGGFMHHRRNTGKIRGDVVLEALLADVAQQLLQSRNLHHTRAAKGFQWIVCKAAAAGIAADFAVHVVGRKTRETHGARFYPADAGSERVFLADRAGDDFLKIHLYVFEEMLRQVAAVETDGLVRIASVVVVP